jgi:hypothetical protein
MPTRTKRASSGASGSWRTNAQGSNRLDATSSKVMLCFRRLAVAFLGSYSIGMAQTYTMVHLAAVPADLAQVVRA